MKKNLLVFAIALQIVILGFTLVTRQITLTFGKELALRPQPYDPRDVFYGDYLRMNFAISQYETKDALKYKSGQRVYVSLTQDGDSWKILELSVIKPKTEPFLKAKVSYAYENKVYLNYGFEQYFIEGGTGKEIERDFAQNADKYLLIISVDRNGNTVVKELKRD